MRNPLNLADDKSNISALQILKSVIDFITLPYFNRVKLGEGGLVVFNLAHSVYAHRQLQPMAIEFVLSLLTMCALYGFNDYTDRHNDANNKKKNHRFVSSILANETLFISVNTLLAAVTVISAFFFLDTYKAPVLIMVYLTNFLYSKRLKAVPVIDIITVMTWGGLFISLSGNFHWQLSLAAGVMTGIAHMFQMMTDKNADRLSKINTTLTAMPAATVFILSGICILLSVLLFFNLGALWAGSGLVPVVVYVLTRKVPFSWYVSRIYFFICWVAFLTSYYGSL